jgi:hypothetical protein
MDKMQNAVRFVTRAAEHNVDLDVCFCRKLQGDAIRPESKSLRHA